MKAPRVHTIDFETKKIESRPVYPPEPAGVSIRVAGDRKSRYYAWGHPTKNNCTKREAVSALKKVWNTKEGKLFHNAKFDIDVAETHLGLKKLPWDQVHDTMFLAFLYNPHATKLDLKSLAEKHLGEPPTEQEALHVWICDHVFTAFPKGEGNVVVAPKKPEGFFKIPPTMAGAFISYAPGDLTGKYADGDTSRTIGLFNVMYPYIVEHGMLEAYNRDRRLLPVLLKSERQGVAVRHRALKSAVKSWEESLINVDKWVGRRLNAPGVDVDKAEELADAIETAGKVGEWILTATGRRSTSKENLIQCIADNELVQALAYRAILANSLRNFGKVWLRMADASGGLIYTNWNQVRSTGAGGKHGAGARTGRLSSNPNFQNISKSPKEVKIPRSLAKHVAPLPYLRSYIGPRKGHLILDRDYSQQELRILGHYEDGVLLEAYQDNPNLDLHIHARDKINELLGTSLDKKPIKGLGFGLIYGMGLAKTADEMGVDVKTAKTIKEAYLSIFPGLRGLIKDLINTGKAGEAIRTWGGREYHVEPPKYDKKRRRWMTYEYKLLNVLIQGSAADCTKEAAIRVDEVCKDSILLMNVHDQLVLDTPITGHKAEMARMREAMESVEFDVPMKSDGKYSRKSWGELIDFKEKA